MPRGPRAAHVNPEMLNAVRDLPVSVVNLSPPDLFLWDDVAASDLVDRFISTNLSPLDPQRPSPVRYRIIEVLAGEEVVRIGFLGISDPRKVKPNSGFRGEDPARARPPDQGRSAEGSRLSGRPCRHSSAARRSPFWTNWQGITRRSLPF